MGEGIFSIYSLLNLGMQNWQIQRANSYENLLNMYIWAFQVALVLKNMCVSAKDIRDAGLIPWSGRSPGRGHGNALQYSCLENPKDREPGGLLPIESQRVRHDWSNLAHTQKYTHIKTELQGTTSLRKAWPSIWQ